MKKVIILLLFVAITVASCKSDDGPKEDCLNCEVSGVAYSYCYTEGDDFYTTHVAGEDTKVPLNGISWTEAKKVLEAFCL